MVPTLGAGHSFDSRDILVMIIYKSIALGVRIVVISIDLNL